MDQVRPLIPHGPVEEALYALAVEDPVGAIRSGLGMVASNVREGILLGIALGLALPIAAPDTLERRAEELHALVLRVAGAGPAEDVRFCILAYAQGRASQAAEGSAVP